MCDTLVVKSLTLRMQLTLIAGIFAIALYSTGFALQLSRLANGGTGGLVAVNRLPVFVAGGMAVLAHVASASGVIYTSTGYHFGIAEISTLIAASISLLVLTSSLRKPLDNLFLGLFPLAVVAIILSLTVSSDYPPTELSAGMAGHVLISILAYSFITIAAVQAGFLAYQNYQLKHGHAGGFLKRFPSLQDMEALLFELLWVGQLLLSLGIVAGFVFISDIWGRDGVIHKSFFSVLAWIVFAVLLWGRHQLGWRGATAIRGTLSGFALLLVGFYGSKFALEFLVS